jgi:hypothetical protein
VDDVVVRAGKYFVLQVATGKHTYTVHSEATDNLKSMRTQARSASAFDEIRNKLTEIAPKAK